MITRANGQSFEVREQMRGGDGKVKLTKLCEPLPNKVRVFSTISLGPGDSIGFHVHEGESELFYFAQGKARVQDNDETFEVNAGDAMATYSGNGHSVKNIGSDELLLVAVVILD